MFKLISKKKFQFYAENFSLSKPMRDEGHSYSSLSALLWKIKFELNSLAFRSVLHIFSFLSFFTDHVDL